MFDKAELVFLLPELTLLGLACLTLLADAFSKAPHKVFTCWLAQLSLLIVATLVFYQRPEAALSLLQGHFVLDPLAVLLKVAICLLAVVAFFYACDYFKARGPLQGEGFVLGLFAVLGMLIMVSARSLLTVYLGLELMSLSLYAMVAMNRDSGAASEAAVKYFVLGALASGILLYGISILYGASGTLFLPELAAHISARAGTDLFLVFGLVFVIVGVAFKLGAVPFHSWVPDVYEGAPTAVTLFLASAPKVAAVAMAIRLLMDGMEPLRPDWREMLMIMAALSLVAGNLIALAQTNIKRMLAYSTIAHVGFLLLGLLPGPGEPGHGYAGALFYVIVYAVMSMSAFGLIVLLGGKDHEADQLDDFKGLAESSPWFAFIALLVMFSLAGVPPFAGFWAKWFVLREVIAIGYLWLAVLAVIFSVVGAYYYLRVVKLMYFDPPPEGPAAIGGTWILRTVASLNGLALLLLGFMPERLMDACVRALGF